MWESTVHAPLSLQNLSRWNFFFAVSSFAQTLAAREFVHFAVLSSPFLFWSHAHSDIRPQETVTVASASAKMPL